METLTSCTLISFDPDAHEAGSAPSETRRKVKVVEKSVGMNEMYQAMGLGLNPEARLLIPYDRDYHGERILEYKGEKWKVIRKATNEYNGVLLTIQRVAGNSVHWPEPEPEPQPEPDPEPVTTDEDAQEA